MQREITIREFEDTVNVNENIEEPIIVKRNNKQDLVVISLEQYNKALFLSDLSNKLEKSEQNLENKKIHSARNVFKKLRKKYGY